MKYENALRTLETRAGSIIGVMVDGRHPSGNYTGCPAAVITILYSIAFISTKHRVVYDERCILWVGTVELGSDSACAPVGLRALRALIHASALHPFNYPWTAFLLDFT